jgi:hypothetical protein
MNKQNHPAQGLAEISLRVHDNPLHASSPLSVNGRGELSRLKTIIRVRYSPSILIFLSQPFTASTKIRSLQCRIFDFIVRRSAILLAPLAVE